MSKDYRIYLKDMLDFATFIVGQASCGKDAFISNRQSYESSLFNFIKLSAASERLPVEIQEKIPGVDWRGIRQFRNLVAHEYYLVDVDTVWHIIEEFLPHLVDSLTSYLEKEV